MIELAWSEFKKLLDAGLKHTSVFDLNGHKILHCADLSIIYNCFISGSDLVEYTANYASGVAAILTKQTEQGLTKVASIKADGNSKTYVSHNFSTNGAPWQFDNLGVQTKVYKAEVQFTMDVIEDFNTNPAKRMVLDIMAGGAPVLSEQKIFNTIFDVYDLGNKHCFTPGSGVASMGGGLVTIVFDYTDTIALEPSYGMGIRFSMDGDLPMGGTHCSVSLVAGT